MRLSRASFHQSEARPVSLVLFGAAAVLATVGDLLSLHPLTALAGVALVAFVLLEFTRIRRPQQIAAALLMIVAVTLGLMEGQLWTILSLGVLKTLPFILIFASVGWLRAAAGESPSLQSLRRGLIRMRPGRRFMSVLGAAHILGAGFNLAGMALLTPILDDVDGDARAGRRMRLAILWGFSTAASWSPFLVGTAVVLASLPGVSWYQMAPYGAFVAAGLLVWGAVFDRLTYGASPARVEVGERQDLKPAAARTLLAILALFALTFSLTDLAGLRLTTAIALAAPGFGLGWLALVHLRGNRTRIKEVARSVVSSYPGMRTESTLFVAANIFGVAISTALPHDHDASAGLPWAGLSTGVFFLDALLMIWAYMAICALGFHPIILLVVFTTLADPAALGLPLPLVGGIFMSLWGMGTAISPLSGTTLFMSQFSAASSFEIAWRWNGLFYALGTFWLALAIVLLA